jgi:hypothetical protein
MMFVRCSFIVKVKNLMLTDFFRLFKTSSCTETIVFLVQILFRHLHLHEHEYVRN